MAATIVTRDPVFGWFAHGGTLKENGDTLRINPRDGLRRRFDVVIPDITLPFAENMRRLKIELERDGFAALIGAWGIHRATLATARPDT